MGHKSASLHILVIYYLQERMQNISRKSHVQMAKISERCFHSIRRARK